MVKMVVLVIFEDDCATKFAFLLVISNISTSENIIAHLQGHMSTENSGVINTSFSFKDVTGYIADEIKSGVRSAKSKMKWQFYVAKNNIDFLLHDYKPKTSSQFGTNLFAVAQYYLPTKSDALKYFKQGGTLVDEFNKLPENKNNPHFVLCKSMKQVAESGRRGYDYTLNHLNYKVREVTNE
jgi:hypothetical protein